MCSRGVFNILVAAPPLAGSDNMTSVTTRRASAVDGAMHAERSGSVGRRDGPDRRDQAGEGYDACDAAGGAAAQLVHRVSRAQGSLVARWRGPWPRAAHRG